MECNKDEAIKAKNIAEKKFIELDDIEGARRFAYKAQYLYPSLEGLCGLIATLEVHFSARKRINGEINWYAVLGVDPRADVDAIRRKYRKLLLLLHPDKNKSVGADVAFQLLSEGWSLLSDTTKRSVYDEKMNFNEIKSEIPNVFHDFMGVMSSATGNQTGSSSSSAPSEHGGTFWTICDSCRIQLEYSRNYMKQNLLCPQCREPFIATEILAPSIHGNGSWNSCLQQQNLANQNAAPSNPNMSQGQSLVVTPEFLAKQGVRGRVPAQPFSTTQGAFDFLKTRRENVSSGDEGASKKARDLNLPATSRWEFLSSENSKVPATSICNYTNVGSSHVRPTSRWQYRKAANLNVSAASRCKYMKAGNFNVSETSRSDCMKAGNSNIFGTSRSDCTKAGDSKMSATYRRDHMKAGDSNMSETFRSDYMMAGNSNPSGTSRSHCTRAGASSISATYRRNHMKARNSKMYETSRGDFMKAADSNMSSAYRRDYMEAGHLSVPATSRRDHEKVMFPQKDARRVLFTKAKTGIQETFKDCNFAAEASKSLNTEAKKAEEEEGTGLNMMKANGVKESLVPGSSNDPGTMEKDPEALIMSVPDPDFYNFDKDRTERAFRQNQVWAAYDDDDGMPRYYAVIHDVLSRKPFKLSIGWLNSKTNDELAPVNWISSGFYKTSGNFWIGKRVVNKSLNSFSHKVKWEKGRKGVVNIYPRKEDVWAVYRNWSPDWNEFTPDEVVKKYDMVKVLDDFDEERGVMVSSLIKVPGFKTVFREHPKASTIKTFPRHELFRFSHQVASYLLTGQEGLNAPKGCLELDPAAMPVELLQTLNEEQAREMEELVEKTMEGIERKPEKEKVSENCETLKRKGTLEDENLNVYKRKRLGNNWRKKKI